jgi:hypothetical protein
MIAFLAFLSMMVFTPDISKEELKRLVAAGVSDDVIVEFIRSHGPVAAMSPEDLIDLKKANVSEKVLSALVAASKAPPSASPEPSENVALPSDSWWFYPYGYPYEYYYGPYFWWYIGPGSPLYRRYPYRSAYYPYPYRYYPYSYRYPRYPYGYHWAAPRHEPPRTRVNPHTTTPPRPPATPHGAPHGIKH